MPEPLPDERLAEIRGYLARYPRESSWPGVAALADLLAEIDRLRAENAELNQLFDLQHKRTNEAAEAWRAADPDNRDGILPDLGELLEWLLDQARRAIDDRNAVAEAAALEFHTGPDAADDEIRRELIARWTDGDHPGSWKDSIDGWRDRYNDVVAKLVRAQIERTEGDTEITQLRAENEAFRRAIQDGTGPYIPLWATIDPHDCSASEVMQLVAENERLVAENERLLEIEQDELGLQRTLAEVDRWREQGCVHVVTGDEGTSHCGLAVTEMAKAIAEIERLRVQRDELIETVRNVAGHLVMYPDDSAADVQFRGQSLQDACDKAERTD